MNQDALADAYAELGYEKLTQIMFDMQMMHLYCFEHAVIISRFIESIMGLF